MKNVRLLFLLVAAIFSVQFVNAQMISLGNEDPCSTDFSLVWELGGSAIVTTHTVGPNPIGGGGTTLNVTAPVPGYLVVQATVTRSGGSPVTLLFPAYPGQSVTGGSYCCAPYSSCHNIIEARWTGTILQGLAAH